MKKVKNILFVHGINYWNIGDLGITDAMITTFKKYFDGANINVVSPYFYWNKPKNLNVEFDANLYADIFTFPNQDEDKSIWKKILFFIHFLKDFFCVFLFLFIHRFTGKNPFLLLTKKQKDTIKIYLKSDIIISKGGGFLFDHGRFLISPHALPIIIGLILRKKVVIYAQSIGPFKRKTSKFLYKMLFKRVSRIIVRERLSQEILKKDFNIESVLGTDAAFGLETTKDKDSIKIIDKRISAIRKKHKMVVGMSMVKWHFPYASDTKEALLKKYRDSLGEAIKYLNKKHDAYFLFFPHSIEGTENDDRFIIQDVIKESGIKDYTMIETEYNPRSLVYTLSHLDFCIGTRMHSNIFTLIGSTPLVAISYLPKTRGIMTEIDLEKMVIDIDKITPEKLIEKVDYLIDNKDDITKKVKKGVQKTKKDEVKNFEYIKEIL